MTVEKNKHTSSIFLASSKNVNAKIMREQRRELCWTGYKTQFPLAKCYVSKIHHKNRYQRRSKTTIYIYGRVGEHYTIFDCETDFETFFKSVQYFFETFLSPHPHLGVSINSGPGTSITYVGLTWEIPFYQHWFGDIMVGGAIHNGNTNKQTKHRKNYGARVLFHTGFALGYLFQENHTLSLITNHISGAKLCKPNPGFTDLGLRYGYRF